MVSSSFGFIILSGFSSAATFLAMTCGSPAFTSTVEANTRITTGRFSRSSGNCPR